MHTSTYTHRPIPNTHHQPPHTHNPHPPPTLHTGEVIRQLRIAKKNKNISAVVLRVDSPGGDALASDLMWREIVALAEKKPVIASMVRVSGGFVGFCGVSRCVGPWRVRVVCVKSVFGWHGICTWLHAYLFFHLVIVYSVQTDTVHTYPPTTPNNLPCTRSLHHPLPPSPTPYITPSFTHTLPPPTRSPTHPSPACRRMWQPLVVTTCPWQPGQL